jgi:hypothetical protein
MSINIFPEPTTSSVNSVSYTIPLTSLTYKVARDFSPGIYTITTNAGSAEITFYDSSSLLSPATTSGSLTYNLGQTVNGFYVTTSSAGAILTFTLTATAITGSALSGTVDTVTTSQTYNQTGTLYVVAFGGGGAGAASNTGWSDSAAGGGGSGYLASSIVVANAPTSITIGAGGNSSGAAGGTTNFGNLLSAGGGSGGTTGGGNSGGDGGGNGQRGGVNSGTRAASAIGTNRSDVISSNLTTGGGSAGSPNGWSFPNGISAAGSGIGTGGAGGNWQANTISNAGSPGTGYASGGGGGASGYYGGVSRAGGAGMPGVVYVLRGI